LIPIAEDFSLRYERVDDDVVIDLNGLHRMFGDAGAIADALQQTASAHGVPVGIAVAATQIAAQLLATTADHPRVIEAGMESLALAPLPIHVLARLVIAANQDEHAHVSSAFRTWGLRTLGELAALPTVGLRARLGSVGLLWQTMARGQDVRPLRPTRADERFDGSVDLEWPIESLEPLSFVLTRLLEPLSVRLEARDRGVATIHLGLHLVTRETTWRHLDLPAPMRDVRTLRTLLLLDAESHPPTAAIDRVTIVIDPTCARIVQHTLFTRVQPAPEHVSTLVARLNALLGSDRIGVPMTVDSERPGAFAMGVFPTTWRDPVADDRPSSTVVTAFRQYRPPVPARVALSPIGEPARVTTDRVAFEDGPVRVSAGPWKTSGAWWDADRWDRDEWDVSLLSGTTYRLAHHRDTNRWFIHGVAD
jgi:protein ImuB